MTEETPVPRRRSAGRIVGLAAAAGAIVGLAAVYVIGSGGGNAGGACAAGAATAAAVKPYATGAVAAFLPAKEPISLKDLAFTDAEGKPRTIADLSGKTVLLNLWATWCVPCREEMPALDRLQAAVGGPDFEVVAVNLDTRDDGRDAAFLKEIGVGSLALYRDRSMDVFNTLKGRGRAVGLPTTLIIDRNGCEIGLMHGPAEWDSEAAKALVGAARAATSS